MLRIRIVEGKETRINKDLNFSRVQVKYEVADVWQIFFSFQSWLSHP